MKYLLICISFLAAWTARAELSATVDLPQTTGNRALVKLTMKNNYTNAVESARAVVFLLGEKGKVIGQRTEWVIGGTREKPGLTAGGTAVTNLLIPAEEPFNKVNVIFSRIILEGGKMVTNTKIGSWER